MIHAGDIQETLSVSAGTKGFVIRRSFHILKSGKESVKGGATHTQEPGGLSFVASGLSQGGPDTLSIQLARRPSG